LNRWKLLHNCPCHIISFGAADVHPGWHQN
jgi:hypothetical protein